MWVPTRDRYLAPPLRSQTCQRLRFLHYTRQSPSRQFAGMVRHYTGKGRSTANVDYSLVFESKVFS